MILQLKTVKNVGCFTFFERIFIFYNIQMIIGVRKFISVFLVSIFFIPLNAQKLTETAWVDSVYQSLTDSQRIGQLFMIRAHSNKDAEHEADVEYLIRNYHVGGLCFFQGTPEKQLSLTNTYQAVSKVPLLISMDAEWGLNMRLKSTTIAYPKQLMLGAIQDNTLIYKFGQAVAGECRRLGVHINYAPVADVNNNPRNTVINERSFGEDKHNVAAKCFQYMLGMQDNGVMACAKHFPGHGDTDMDSHYTLPLISKDISSLNALELMPFRVLSQQGIGGLMMAHLQVPAIDNTANMPMSLSKNAIRQLLRSDIGFDGLIFTDAMEMEGVKKYYTNGEAEAKAIEAGCDMLCLPESIPASFAAIKRYMAEGKITDQDIEASVKRILRTKFHYGLATPQYIEPFNVRNDINSFENLSLKRELIKNALTLVRDEQGLLPFKSYQADDMASLSLGSSRLTPFQYMLNNYGIYNQFNVSKEISAAKKKEMLGYFSKKKTVIVSIHDMKSTARNTFGISEDERDFVNELSQVTQVVLVVFGNPYSLKYLSQAKTVLECYNEDKITQELAAEGLFGVFEFKGKLPISACDNAKCGMGFTTPKLNKLEWNTEMPEAVGMNGATLLKIDGIAEELIASHAAPSCQILVAKNGQVIYHKAFGYQAYDKTQQATTEDMYDLASITKCAATTVCLMKLYEEGKIDLDEKLSTYLPFLKGSNKEKILIREVLIHQAGLLAWIPFYKNTLETAIIDGSRSTLPSSKWYSTTPTDVFSVEVARNLYMNHVYVDSMKQQIADSPLRGSKSYLYSDLGLILLTDIIKNITGKTLDQYVTETFYDPLSISRTLFRPLQRFSESAIVPTEEDRYFRKQTLRGHVHDMAAAMLGGVSGHAGLFSTTADLAVLLQMLLNKGEYAGIRYLKPETIALFTTRQGGSTRRGLGWEMKELDGNKKLNMSPYANSRVYGHTGFTGNAFYADPDNNLIYVFLSNRTYPDSNNNKLINGDYRPRIQSVIYEALVK